mgnify:CR=1 FL=1
MCSSDLIHGIIHCVQRYDGVIRHARETGEISWGLVREDDTPEGTPATDAARLERLIAEAGGIDALEGLAGFADKEEPPSDGDTGGASDPDGGTEPETGPGRMAG